ncbi:MAG TPA: complex I subunit 1 family protein [Aggregatilineaceae bacterium]|nr:complex I subunit 1 family protein [Aggregatilineaceae bacterium]
MDALKDILALLIFPGGICILLLGMVYEWVDRKLVARLQNRMGPRWFQPMADTVKLLAKEEVVPSGIDSNMFLALPVIALAGALTSVLYVPIFGLDPSYSFNGDLVVAIYMLSLLTISTGLAGANTLDRFSLMGATRTLTQMFSYEAPFLLALLGPAIVAGSWEIKTINDYASSHTWFMFTQPIGFIVALIGLMGKLELPPFDAPEAETEIVAGAMTEYSGRGLALFHLGRGVELVVGLTLAAAFYFGGVGNPLLFLGKTLLLLVGLAGVQSLMTRLRIDQTVGLWWRYGALLVLVQFLVLVLVEGMA